jgi:hypothetical protein
MVDPKAPTSYWQALAHAADDGQLYLNAEAAEACSAACDSYIEKLKLHQRTAADLAYASGWGDFAMGLELQKIMANKAVGGRTTWSMCCRATSTSSRR